MKKNLNKHPSSTKVLTIVGLIGLAGLLTLYFTPYIDNLPTLIIIALGSTLIGTFVGFLFGFPKTNKKKNLDKSFHLNTNLEEITDWLTKILVGLGISQIPTIKSNLASLVNFVNNGNDLPDSVILFSILYFTIYGFFIGYLSSSLYLKSLLDNTYFNAESFIHDIENILEKYYGTGKVYIDSKFSELNDKLAFDKLKVLKIIEYLEKNDKDISANAYRNIGIQFFKYHDYDTALELFFKSARVDNNAHALSNIGVTLSKHLNKPKLGEKYIQDALRMHPDNALANYNYACLLLRKNKISTSLEYLQKSIDIGGEEFLHATENDSVWMSIKDNENFKKIVPDYGALN